MSRVRVADHVAALAKKRASETLQASPEWLRVAAWLRGDLEKLDSLLGLLASRVEGRGSLDIPSTPHECAIVAGMDKEARLIMQTLSAIHDMPVNVASSEEEE